MEDRTRDLLIATIKSAFGINVDGVQLSEQAVQEMLRVASRQAILFIVITGIKKLGYENLLAEDTQKQAAKASFDYIQRREALKEISNALDAASVAYIPLKGAVLRDLYPNPCMRSSSDIDVLVREEELGHAIEALEEHTSFKYYMKGHHDAHLKNQRLHLELHFSLLTNVDTLDGVLQIAWEYSFSNGEGSCYSFTPEYQVFYNVAHAAKHLIKEGGIGIRPLLDMWLLRTKTEYDEKQVRSFCEEGGILGFYDMCCNLLSAWFEGEPYSDETKEFENLVFDGGVFGSEHRLVVSRGRKNTGAKYMINRVFLSGKEMKEIYPVCSKHPSLVPVYQAVRWTHLLAPSKRKKVRSEIRQARSLNLEEVEKYDQLMKRMGL